MITQNSKVFLSGHNGMVGSAILRKLKKLKYKNIFTQTRKQLDLRDQRKVYKYLSKIKPNVVIIASAKVGGIQANSNLKAEFIFDNLSIQNNLIDGSYKNGVKNLIFLGSSCVYPKESKQPIKEEYLLSNFLSLIHHLNLQSHDVISISSKSHLHLHSNDSTTQSFLSFCRMSKISKFRKQNL